MEWLELLDVPTSGLVASSGTATDTATNNKNKRNSGAEVRNKQKRRGKNNKNKVDEDESMTNEEFSDDERDHFNRYQNNDLSDVTSTSSIVYVNFGWMSRIEKTFDALLNGLTDPRLRNIWTMSNDQRSLLPKNIPPSFKILNKLGQSTMHLLRRQEVKIVVSHCGMGVAQEALMFGKPLHVCHSWRSNRCCCKSFRPWSWACPRQHDHELDASARNCTLIRSNIQKSKKNCCITEAVAAIELLMY